MGGGQISQDIKKLRQDVLKQAIASLASFMGGVNYSDSFHMSAAAQVSVSGTGGKLSKEVNRKLNPKRAGIDLDEPDAEAVGKFENPLYDTARMSAAVTHANATTVSFGVEILSINILSAVPVDRELMKALGCGAVASAEALQAETAARGNAKAMRINAEAAAEKSRIEAEGEAQSDIIRARAQGEAARLVAEGNK